MRPTTRSSLLVLPALSALAVLGTLEGQADAAAFLVTSTSDSPDFAPGNGFCASAAGVCTLRAAVMEANALAGADTITITGGMPMISLVTVGAGENAAATGDLDIAGTLTIVGNGAILGGFGSDRLFHVLTGATVDISGVSLHDGWGDIVGGAIYNQGDLELSDCVISDNSAIDHGGAIKSITGSLVVRSCEIFENDADRGGAIYSTTDLVIEDSTLYFNDAGLYGGAVYATGTGLAEITASYIGANTAGDRGGGVATLAPMNFVDTLVELNEAGDYGGGLWMYTDAAIVDAFQTDFQGNSATDGGGIQNFWGDLTLRRVNVSDNVASGSGGGIDNQGTLIAQRSAIATNSAASGGGLRNYGVYAELTMHNVTVSGNSATGSGGGLRIDASSTSTDLNNVTIASNTGTSGGIQASGSTVMINTIVGDNLDLGGAASDCVGSTTSNGHNLIEDVAACVIAGPATADVYSTAPGLDPLAFNGGRTPTHAVQAGSAARNAGDNATCRPADQRGVARPLGGTCEIGAYERN